MEAFLSPLTKAEEEDCIKRLNNNDKSAREQLILHNMRLVAHVTKKYSVNEDESEELISIGTVGLIKAVSSFKADYGSRFATYAIRCIENEILMYYRSKKKTKSDVSLFEPIGTDKEGNQIQLMDVIENDDIDVSNNILKNESIDKLNKYIKEVLSEREYYILVQRYGLLGHEEMTQRQIAKTLGISRSYVSRIEKRALDKLKKVLEF
nr:RNA polymerase sporulation sigma factor SigK [uncultured Agathobacter sp.]